MFVVFPFALTGKGESRLQYWNVLMFLPLKVSSRGLVLYHERAGSKTN